MRWGRSGDGVLFRRPTQVALNASMFLALQPEGAACPVHEIAAALDVPAPYLSKVLGDLLRARLLLSVRGPGGGVHLARSPKEIRLGEVVSATGTLDSLEDCILGIRECNEVHPCPLHPVWAQTRAEILDTLHTKSLRDFAIEAQARPEGGNETESS